MAPRSFDGHRVREVRRAANLTQSALATRMGVADATVAGWETGQSAPDGEKLPALAAVLQRGLDELFPREGLPDLADLRCDAGYSQYETKKLIGTKSAGPVANAERGKRPLSSGFVQPLAEAYGVSAIELLAAQERSFGNDVPAPAPPSPSPGTDLPATLGEKINYLLEHSYPGDQKPPGNAEIAQAVNAYAGATVLSEGDVDDLRSDATETVTPIVREGLADLFGVEDLYFQSDEAVARQVIEGLRFLAAARKGNVLRVGARGLGPEGIPEEVLAFLNQVVEELEEKELPGT
ncbi:helix-turn-helix transcriptional regulator [Streptomyces jumonjinensis]|uniref:Helix-turn-helix domain-containing protein n=1 Tax=Streptomyces jumonjinensis TaxID=1945 RepID=A0A646KSJ5_STRJU|nr:helix-turn-helix transcriptional regulator [Streptomyces jumonjinensis]MQT05058.1 helix-turn-helix domain-containing protein [Streptomyces jumonjinensis]